MKQIKKIGVISTANIVGIFSAVSSAIFTIPLGLFSIVSQQGDIVGGIFLLLFPLLYFGIGFIAAALFCLLYNVVAKKIGGIQLKITDA